MQDDEQQESTHAHPSSTGLEERGSAEAVSSTQASQLVDQEPLGMERAKQIAFIRGNSTGPIKRSSQSMVCEIDVLK